MNAKPPMPSTTPSSHDMSSAATPSYSPSVPLSVYRELAAELQAAEAMVDSLSTQNQQLSKQNQQLRQEIGKAVQTVLQLQQVVDSLEEASWRYPNQTPANLRTEPSRPVPKPRPVPRSPQPPARVAPVVEDPHGPTSGPTREVRPAFAEQVYAEQQYIEQQEQGRYRRSSQPETASEINGWWLALAILLIVLTAFGAGYLIVRPLLQNR